MKYKKVFKSLGWDYRPDKSPDTSLSRLEANLGNFNKSEIVADASLKSLNTSGLHRTTVSGK